MFKFISENPFRFLGVFSNSKQSEIVSNCDDMEAYLSVGQSVSFDLDLDNLIPKLKRTEDSVQNAKKEINLAKDKLKWALFWFCKDASSQHAINHLKNGNIEGACVVFDIEDSFATQINKSVVAYIKNDIEKAILYAINLIHTEEYRRGFINSVCGATFQISEDELWHLYVDAVLAEMSVSNLQNALKKCEISNYIEYINKKAVEEPKKNIEKQIAEAKAINREDALANYNVGVRLMTNTKSDLFHLKQVFGESNFEYQFIADELAETILQCGINYFNHTDDDDDVDKALKLQEYACKIAVGSTCKERCNKNLGILHKKKAEQAPKEVIEFDKKIKDLLNKYNAKATSISNAIQLVVDSAPTLVEVKQILGSKHNYYLKISTLIVKAALHDVIEEVNDVQNQQGNYSSHYDFLDAVKRTIKEAWRATLYMDRLDKESDYYKKSYQPNRTTLQSMVNALNISTYSISVSLDMRTEDEFFNTCKTSADFECYIKKYPSGKYINDAKKKYEELRISEVKIAESQKRDDVAFKKCNSKSDYKEYLRKFPNGLHRKDAEYKIKEINEKAKSTGCFVIIIIWVLTGAIMGAIAGGPVGFFVGGLLAFGFIAKGL